MTAFNLSVTARTLARTVALSGLLPLFASAASYYQWETITPAASTGASCGNGTPIRACETAKPTQPAPTSNAFTQLLAQIQKALGL